MKLTIEEERELVEQAKQDWSAFEGLYAAYVKEIYYYILARVREKELAEDITSETFSKAMTKIKQFKWKGFRFSSWLYKIASNQIAEHYRKSKRVQSVDVDTVSRIEDKDSISFKRELDQESEKGKLMETVRKLKPSEQVLVILKYFQDKSYEEIAEITGLQANNVGVKLHRIIKKLQNYI